MSQSLRDDLHAVKMKFNKCVFDNDKCEEGLKALKQYHRKYNEDRNTLSFSVGSALTAAAIPEKEYEECFLKARALIEVLALQGICFD